MKKALFFPLQVSLCTVGCLYASSGITHAQVTPDGTVNTQINQDGNSAVITGGETRGSNLFHSFQDFSVGTGNEAFFNNADSISNIFSRVTGGNISNIDGLIRANGSASLFLINPAGIIFGENARLDIGGSFYGSTASSILFEDGEFSAADLENPPLLTVNAPVGLGFRDSPGDIENNSVANDGRGLEVSTGNNISLLGGDIRFSSGNITAPGGVINLGGLTAEGTINFADNGSLSFPEETNKSDISIANSSTVSVLSNSNGSIFINSEIFELTSGSSLIAGISSSSTEVEAQAGNILINANDSISLRDADIFNQVESNGIGNSGDIEINTSNINLSAESRISSSTFGQGDAGNIVIEASESISVSESSDVFAVVFDSGIGNGGEISFTTSELNLTDSNSLISVSTLGQGDAGRLNINASDSVSVSDGSAIFAIVTASGIGNGGDINITTSELSLSGANSLISVSTLGQGNAGKLDINATESISINNEADIFAIVTESGIGNSGDIDINTTNLSIENGSQISSTTFSRGKAGNISIQAENIDISNNSDSLTGIFAFVDTEAIGNGGQININTNKLNINNEVPQNSFISVSTFGQGDAGVINISATESINLFSRANIWAIVSESGIGDAGSVNIETSSLELDDFSKVSVESFGQGNSGSLVVEADFISLLDASQIIGSIEGIGEGGSLIVNAETIEIIDSFGSGGTTRPTGIVSNVNQGGVGNSGNIEIAAKNISLDGFRAEISASVFGKGNAGDASVSATESINITNSSGIFTDIFNTDATGEGGNLTIETPNLSLSDQGTISVSNLGQGNAGILAIDTDILNILGGSGITGNVSGTGDGADILINAKSIQIDDLFSQTGTSRLTSISANIGFEANGDAGNITITTEELKLSGFNSQISSSLSSGVSSGNGGILDINASKFISIEGTSSASSDNTGIFASVLEDEATGNSGSVNISTPLLLLNDGTISVNNQGQGNGGELLINSDSIDLRNNSLIIAETVSQGGANIILNVSEDIVLHDSSLISAEAFNNANGGNLTIDSRFIIAFPNGNSDILASAEQGQGGNITINAESLFGIQERTPSDSTNDINASSQVSGLDGTISISTPDINPAQGATELPTNVVEPGETTEQACQANREALAKGGLNILGKGGIVPDPALPLNSLNVIANGENPTTSTIPAPIETAQGKIQPARGVKVTESGEVILTAYRTNNSGDRLPEKRNCG